MEEKRAAANRSLFFAQAGNSSGCAPGQFAAVKVFAHDFIQHFLVWEAFEDPGIQGRGRSFQGNGLDAVFFIKIENRLTDAALSIRNRMGVLNHNHMLGRCALIEIVDLAQLGRQLDRAEITRQFQCRRLGFGGVGWFLRKEIQAQRKGKAGKSGGPAAHDF